MSQKNAHRIEIAHTSFLTYLSDFKPLPQIKSLRDRMTVNIYEFTPSGAQSTFASGLLDPTGLAFDGAGNLFVADTGSDRIYEFTPGGVKSTYASYGDLDLPVGLAFDSAGNLFVSVWSASVIKITPSGAQTIFTSGLNIPTGLAFDDAGNLFVANASGNNVTKITPSGDQSTFASGLNGPHGLAFQSQTLPVPEPSTLLMLVRSLAVSIFRRGCRAHLKVFLLRHSPFLH